MAGQEIAHRTPMQETLAELASDNFQAKIQNALPEKVSPQRFVSVAVTAVKQNPELITVERDSLFNSIVRCAQDGLMPDGREAALVIFKPRNGQPKAQYMPMIGGYRKIAAQHGITLVADVVRAGDQFDYSRVPPTLMHKPAPLGDERGEIVGAYAVAYRDGRMVAAPEVMRPDEIEQVRAVSRAATSEYGPWVKWWDRMAAKTVARRLFSQLPIAETDEQADRIIAASDAEYDFGGPAAMGEQQANAIAAASTNTVPTGERQQLREEPQSQTLPDALLNRLAKLQEQVDERMWRATLRGVFGVDDPAKLDEEDAGRYEQTLRAYLTTDGEPVEGEIVDDDGQTSFADRVPDAVKKSQRQSRAKEEGR